MNIVTLLMLFALVCAAVVSSLAFVGLAIEALVWRQMLRRQFTMVPRDESLEQLERINENQIRAQAHGALCLAIAVTMAAILLATIASVRVMNSEFQSFILIGTAGLVTTGIGYVAVKYYDTHFCNAYLRSRYFDEA